MTTKELRVGENIKKVRELKGYTQEYMADRLGVSQRTYCSIEKENKKIDTERLQNIAEILEVSIFDLLNFNDRIFFSNNKCTHFGAGVAMYSTVHSGTGEQLEKYEEQMKEMRSEIHHLREQVNFLQELIQKQFNSK